MRSLKDRLVKLLDSKLELFERMEKILIEQKNHLQKLNLEAFREKSEAIDDLIDKIKKVDYEIARCESDCGSIAGMIESGDAQVNKILNDAIKTMGRSHILMIELAEQLGNSYDEIKETLGNTVSMSRISGYKSVTRPSPIYVDKVN